MKAIYDSLSLNGAWQMHYRQTDWEGETLPDFEGWEVADAVPGYWEDMEEAFRKTGFFRDLRINPEYGLQQYPIAQWVPDMALPNIVGCFLYRKGFACENPETPSAIFFEGVQNTAKVWLNGVYLGEHRGYSAPFEMEIPQGVLRHENTLVLAASNIRLKGALGEPVSGLTSRAANECTGGITGDVQLRQYPGTLRDLVVRVAADCSAFTLEVTADGEYAWKLLDKDRCLASGTHRGNLTIPAEGLTLWTPECPKRYTLELTEGERVLRHTFGIRRLLPDGTGLKLNGEPVFLRGITEHCYFPETVHPHHDKVYYRRIIRGLKELGFNFIRFHTWVPPREYMEAAA